MAGRGSGLEGVSFGRVVFWGLFVWAWFQWVGWDIGDGAWCRFKSDDGGLVAPMGIVLEDCSWK